MNGFHLSDTRRAEMRAQARQLVADADSVLQASEREHRPPTPAEARTFEAAIGRARRLERRAAGEAAPEEDASRRGDLYRALGWLVEANGRADLAVRFARESRDFDAALLLKAATAVGDSTTTGWAAELVAPALGELIGLLRARSALFALAPDPMPLVGSVAYPRVMGGSASGFVPEGGAIPVRAGALELLALAPFKAAGICVGTGELWRRSDVWAEQYVTGTLSDDIALGVDQVFLSDHAAVANTSPAGIFNSTNAATVIGATAGGDAAACATDLAALLAAGAAFTSPKLLINPSAIAAALALSGSSSFAIIQALATGRIGPRVEVVEAGNITPDTIALVDADGLLVGAGGIELETSDEGTLHMETAPADDLGGAGNPTPVVSLFQRDLTAARVTLPITWRSKRVSQVQHIAGATWV
jgi:HK97 family phage major capsid protein